MVTLFVLGNDFLFAKSSCPTAATSIVAIATLLMVRLVAVTLLLLAIRMGPVTGTIFGVQEGAKAPVHCPRFAVA